MICVANGKYLEQLINTGEAHENGCFDQYMHTVHRQLAIAAALTTEANTLHMIHAASCFMCTPQMQKEWIVTVHADNASVLGSVLMFISIIYHYHSTAPVNMINSKTISTQHRILST